MAIRIIHVGVGVRGRHWLDVVADHPDFTSVACVDRDEKALDQVRSLPGQEHGKFFANLEEALAETEADAALIVTPSFLHAQQATQALRAGLGVLVEKPLAVHIADAAATLEVAREVNRPLMVAENFRFFQAERTVRALLDQGKIGRVLDVSLIDRRDQPSHSQGPWVKTMADPFLNEIAVHHFDSLRYLFNSRPQAIFARSFNPTGSDYDEGAALEAFVTLENGVRVQYSGTMVATRYQTDLWIRGESGDIRTDRKTVSWRLRGHKQFEPMELAAVPKGDELPYPRAGTVSLLNQFRDAMTHGLEPETSGRDNIWTLAMVEAAKVSQSQEREVRIDEVFHDSLKAQAGVNPLKLSAPNDPPARAGSGDRRRVLFIGLDSADAELIEQWEAEGSLPNIARMRARGLSGRLGTTAEILHVSAWPSIFTGVTPDKHGLYHAYVMNPGEQSPIRPRPDKSAFPFFWRLLSDRGKRSIVMDAFMTCPLQNFNGSQIVEWGTWSWFWEPTILPGSLKAEIERKFGNYPAPEHSKVAGFPDSRWFRDVLVAAVQKKAQVVNWLMDSQDWDLFLTVFGETHPAGHYLWHWHDESYPKRPDDADPSLRDALKDVYVAIDKAIGQILAKVDQRTTVFLVSGDGMGPNYSGSHLLEELLQKMQVLTKASGGGGQQGSAGGAKKPRLSRDNVLSRVRSMVPQSLRTAVSQKLFSHAMKEKLALKWLTAGIAWEATRAFLISNANEGFVRVNLKGREPQGIVNPGPEYQALIDELCSVFATMTSPAGTPAAVSIHRADDLFKGPCRDSMPDIIVNWNADAMLTDEMLTERFGLIDAEAPGYGVLPFYVGNHRPNAFAIVAGAEVPHGRLDSRHILDLAPTLLQLFDISAPEYMDGRIIEELQPHEAALAG